MRRRLEQGLIEHPALLQGGWLDVGGAEAWPESQLDAAVPSVYSELAATEGDKGEIDQCGDVARLAHCKSVFGVLGAAHERWPVVREAVAEDGENDGAEHGYERAAACYECDRASVVPPHRRKRQGPVSIVSELLISMLVIVLLMNDTYQGRCLRRVSPSTLL